MMHTITHININGMRTHTQEKQAFLKKSKIFSIQDTRLKPDQNLLPHLFNNYSVYEIKHDRHNAGIALAIHNSIKHQQIRSTATSGHAIITVKISDKQIYPHDLHISSLHAPPLNSRHRGADFNTQLLQQSLSYKHAIVTGDLNARHKQLGCKGTNTHGKHLYNFLMNKPYIILNDTAETTFTHNGMDFSDTLDYAIATPNILRHIHTCFINKDIGSDHLPLCIDFKNIKHQTSNIKENSYNIKLTDWPKFTKKLQEHVTNDIEIWPPKSIKTPNAIATQTGRLIKHFQTAIQDSTPKHRTPNPDNPRLPANILLLIRSRRNLKRMQRTNPNTYQRTEINELNKAIKKAIKKVKQTIAKNKAKILQTGPRHGQFWPTIKTLLDPYKHLSHHLIHNNLKITKPEEKNEIFTEHFKQIFTSTANPTFDNNFKLKVESRLPNLKPLNNTREFNDKHTLTKEINLTELKTIFKTLKTNKAPGKDKITYEHIKAAPDVANTILLNIYNAMLKTAFIPSHFKTATISVIPKANKDPHLVGSYRPITLAPTLGKTFERIINSRLLTYTLDKKILHENQTAFLPGKETTENILSTLQQITNNYNNKKFTLLIALDIQQAFDRTWHAGILHTLSNHTSLHFCRIINSFLTNRTISIKYENTTSKQQFTPTQGVPQGSPLSPLLFNLLLSTAPFANTDDVITHNYADDTFFTASGKTPTEAWQRLQPHIENFMRWCNKYRLNIQAQKTNATFFTRRRGIPDTYFPTININNTIIPRSNHLTILGATLDMGLTLQKHIEKINTGTHATINKIRKLQSTHRNIHPWIAILLYKTLIRTKFTYAAPLLSLLKPTSWLPLQHTENRAMRAAHRTGIRTRITHLLKKSKIPPIQEHYKKISRNTLIRLVNNKNSRLLKTIFVTHPRTGRAYTTPPLDHTIKQLPPAERKSIKRYIQNIIQKPP